MSLLSTLIGLAFVAHEKFAPEKEVAKFHFDFGPGMGPNLMGPANVLPQLEEPDAIDFNAFKIEPEQRRRLNLPLHVRIEFSETSTRYLADYGDGVWVPIEPSEDARETESIHNPFDHNPFD